MDRNKEKIDLIKKVYSKTDYTKIIDTRFQQLGNISVNQQIDETVTVNDFFESYNDSSLAFAFWTIHPDLSFYTSVTDYLFGYSVEIIFCKYFEFH